MMNSIEKIKYNNIKVINNSIVIFGVAVLQKQ